MPIALGQDKQAGSGQQDRCEIERQSIDDCERVKIGHASPKGENGRPLLEGVRDPP